MYLHSPSSISTIACMDRLIVLDGGNIVEAGRYFMQNTGQCSLVASFAPMRMLQTRT